MSKALKHACLLGVAVLAGSIASAAAHMDGPNPPDGPLQGLLHRERLSDRLLKEYDLNHDGRITRAEYNNVLGTRFAAATSKHSGMTSDQFTAMHQSDFREHIGELFRRIDWNGDGKITLDEFAAPQRARFQMMDRDGGGTVTCAGEPGDGAFSSYGRSGARGYGGGSFARARFCSDGDQSRDGKVTRAEFDAKIATQFRTAANGAAVMTLATFASQESTRFRDMNERMFRRLDQDDDGRLTIAEFAAPPLKLFAKLDRDHNGVLTADELKPRFQRGPNGRGPDQPHADD